MKEIIENTFGKDKFSAKELAAIKKCISELNAGTLRVAEKNNSTWHVNEWVKKAILLYFKIQKIKPMRAGEFLYLDKIPTKKWSVKDGVRVVPHAIARYGSFVNKGAILMPSYVNIGAFVDSGTMVDTWATVGSCAQIGKNVHLSGGVGIGGVLEPLQASPVIIEDDVFIGSRSIIVEGVRVKEGAVIGAGVTLTASSKIIDVSGSKEIIYQGEVPENSVVIPGSMDKSFNAGVFKVNCALIIGKRKPSTDKKTSLNHALRDFAVSV